MGDLKFALDFDLLFSNYKQKSEYVIKLGIFLLIEKYKF